ncbi:precorrin-6Y C5,15-methyltransferase (decarboxylating) subunit CbiT [Acetobacterium fimetarium]|uniref:Precorrin-6Y C5,15-methyltransferase (Decarboxylating) subunit CbiT n=1 Tax=Acetobacterium fimetarium TaxID=52691 RepID=A0ABR6WSU4_9FIRM|nr:precorrin-6Y C5,15-methyltransferase (decarboxylating) subunit CbiT [Acetobacterium fimetarium]MBC3803636.1 precorrin-6Y C5,15-methyltransferase (decarboxylating) subunit CbiT [Acetobacterium fimetarium]
MSKIAGYKDEAYIRGKAPMTKREIRILTISLLGIEPGDVVVDIGAGTGGLTMEAAYAAAPGRVYAVEAKETALELVQQNKEHFQADNVVIIPGKAPAALDQITEQVDRVIIGGSGGNMEDLFEWCRNNIRPGGRVVANFVTLENAAQATTLMNRYFDKVELIQVGISRGEGIGGLTMLKAANPIFIITGDVATKEV